MLKIIQEKLTFGEALEAIKQGKLISRNGWNGKGMFIFQRPSDEIKVEDVIEKITSLPQSVKDYYADYYSPENYKPFAGNFPKIKFTEYLCLKAADGLIVNGWLASQSDILSSDWQILENIK